MEQVEVQTIVDLTQEQFAEVLKTGEVITRQGVVIKPTKMDYSPRYSEAIATYLIDIIN